MLALSVLPLGLAPIFLAGAVEQLGLYGARGGVAAVMSAGVGLACAVAGGLLVQSREEVRLDGATIVSRSGRGWVTERRWAVAEVQFEVAEVVVYPRRSWKVEIVGPTGRCVVGRTNTEAEANALVATLRAAR